MDFYDARVKARIAGAPPPGWGAIALIRNEVSSHWYGQPSQRGLLVFTPPGEAIDGCIVPGFLGIAIHVPPPVWESCASLALAESKLPNHFPEGRGTVNLIPNPCFDRIERDLLELRQLLSPGFVSDGESDLFAIARQLITNVMTLAWEYQLPNGFPQTRDRHGPRNRARLARRAEDWLRAHLHESLAISEVCLAMRVSRREMEYAFRQAFDLSPRDFLQALRLNAIHRALQRCPPDRGMVTQIAMEHGVTHLGRFAGRYRDLFGELPGSSSTKKRKHQMSDHGI